MCDSKDNLKYYSAKILQMPYVKNKKVHKGAIILSQVDSLVRLFPTLINKFYIIERRAWEGINNSIYADIKLVEDLSTWEKTKEMFPKSILLDIGPADFVDTKEFYPLSMKKEIDGIQISSWDRFKRPLLFIKGCSLLPMKRFIKFGHFVENGNSDELGLVTECLKQAKRISSNIDFLYSSEVSNEKLPNTKQEINLIINKCKIGILTTKVEGINRFKMECLAANIPVLVPNDCSFPTKKHINSNTGVLFDPTPEGLSSAIRFTLDNIKQFSPRSYITEVSGATISLEKLKAALCKLCKRDSVENDFKNIFWDGRNQSLVWEEKVLSLLNYVLKEIIL